jgi:hypothetical protein
MAKKCVSSFGFTFREAGLFLLQSHGFKIRQR